MRYSKLLMTTGVLIVANSAAAANDIKWTVYSPADKARINLTLNRDASVGELAGALKKYCGAQGNVARALIADRRGVSEQTPAIELNEYRKAPGLLKLGDRAGRPGSAAADSYPYIKLGGLKYAEEGGETQAAGGYLKIGDIKGESQEAASSSAYIKFDGVDGESQAAASGGEYLKFGDIEGEAKSAGRLKGEVIPKVELTAADPYKVSRDAADYKWKIVGRPSDQCEIAQLYRKEKK